MNIKDAITKLDDMEYMAQAARLKLQKLDSDLMVVSDKNMELIAEAIGNVQVSRSLGLQAIRDLVTGEKA